MTKMAKIDILFMTKTAEKPYPLGRTYLYSPYKGVAPREPYEVNEWRTKSSKRFFRLTTIISSQQVSHILSGRFLFYHSCKLLDCELWVTNSNGLKHCSGGTAVTLFKLGPYFKIVVAEMVTYDCIIMMGSSLKACIQTLKDLVHRIRKVMNKTFQRLGGWKKEQKKEENLRCYVLMDWCL